MSARVQSCAAAAACVCGLLLLVPLQRRIDASNGAAGDTGADLYLSSPAAIAKASLGYSSLVADLYWMRAVQYYGRRDEAARRSVRYKDLWTLLDITTTLDPDLLEVYRAGASFLAEPDPVGAGEPGNAVRLLDKGIRAHPENWRLRLDKGFVYFWFFKDYRRAGDVWLEASRLRTAPPWMEGLAAKALSKGGAIDTARALWLRQYRDSQRSDVRENARNHLLSMQVCEDLWTLEYLIGKYREAAGALPRAITDLVRSGLAASIPKDPSGVPYEYNPETGGVALSSDTRFRFIEVPEDYKQSFLDRLEQVAARKLSAAAAQPGRPAPLRSTDPSRPVEPGTPPRADRPVR